MGLMDFFRPKKQRYKYAQMLNGRMPIFSQFGTNIYASDVVQQACFCIVQEIKKLTPRHVRRVGSDVVPKPGRLQAVLDAPNAVMTTADMLERIAWAYLINYNAWIIPVWDAKGKLEALWPVNPVRVTFIEDAAGRLGVTMEFQDGTETTLLYSDLIHVKHHYFANDYMGGDASGQPDNAAILETVELNATLMQGVAKGLKSSYAVNGVVKYNTMLDDGTMKANIDALTERLQASESGLMGMDLKGEFVPIKKEIKLVDKDTLQFIDSKILRHFGVSIPIITGDYTPEQLAAFYQKSIEPFVVAVVQAFTKGIFSRLELGHNNAIEFYPEELIFMSTAQKLELVRLLGDSGALFENEKRRIFGMQPLPELVGRRVQSLNYVDTSIAANYQLDEKKKEDGTDAQDEAESSGA
ncbi:MAG: phage portal protein [Clostridia bacterium]|nr:phage portal protein [Clostridia bacterium]